MHNRNNLFNVLRHVANRYPADMIDEQARDIPRIAFNIGIALDAAKPKPPSELELCDLGGGIGLFSAGCAAFGLKRTVLVDDFDDSINHQVGASILDWWRQISNATHENPVNVSVSGNGHGKWFTVSVLEFVLALLAVLVSREKTGSLLRLKFDATLS